MLLHVAFLILFLNFRLLPFLFIWSSNHKPQHSWSLQTSKSSGSNGILGYLPESGVYDSISLKTFFLISPSKHMYFPKLIPCLFSTPLHTNRLSYQSLLQNHLYRNCWTNISTVLFGSILSSLKHVNLLCLWNSSGNRVEEAPWDISQGSENATSIFSVYLHPPSETNLCE